MNATAPEVRHEYLFRLAAVALTVFVLYIAKPVLVPLTLAMLLAFILSPVVALGERIRLGRLTATLLTLVVAGSLAAVVVVVISSQVVRLAEELPAHQAEIEAKLDRLAGTEGPFSRLGDMVREIARKRADPATVQPALRVQVDDESDLQAALQPALLALKPVATAGLVTVLMVFILLGREDLRSRFLATLGRARLVGTVRVIEDSARRVGRFLLFQLLVNASLGVLLTIGLALMGVPYAPLWGFLTTMLRFIPFVGTWISLLLPLSISFATAPDWQQPLMIVAYFAVLDLVTANVVEPLLFGHQTGVSPIALLVAAAFWTWIWGPIGLLLSTPLTVCVAVLGQHIAPLRTLGVLLGDKPALAPHVEYYQRVLAEGAEAAQGVALAAAASHGTAAAFDTVLVPAVAGAHQDRAAGELTMSEEIEMREAALSAIGPLLSASIASASIASGSPSRAPLPRPAVVLGAPAHDDSEEVPLHMLSGLFAQSGGRLVVMATRQLPADVIRHIQTAGATAVIISSMPPAGLPQTAYLCRQIRKHYPDLPVIVARWGARANYDDLLVRLRKAGASYLTTSFAQTLAQMNASAQPGPPAALSLAHDLHDQAARPSA